ncbi:hypothetical protein EDB85DRAFT_1896151 [Lactarius pseudohatsudake]|nr:hypothetical protein EDB85DRAFT_1896151 [Lactarius pseudohatsudake]
MPDLAGGAARPEGNQSALCDPGFPSPAPGHNLSQIETTRHRVIPGNGVNSRANNSDKIKRAAPQLVEATWEEVPKKSSSPPDRWIHDREVLVGRNAHQPQTDGGDNVH